MQKRFDLSDGAIRSAIKGRPSNWLEREVSRASLYFLRCETFIKIGWGASAQNRLSSIQTNSPFPISLEHFIETTRFAANASEAYLHLHLMERRVRGEWFRLAPAELRYLHDSIRDLVDAMEHFETNSHDSAFFAFNGATRTVVDA